MKSTATIVETLGVQEGSPIVYLLSVSNALYYVFPLVCKCQAVHTACKTYTACVFIDRI